MSSPLDIANNFLPPVVVCTGVACTNCLSISDNSSLKTCSACKRVRYCNRDCQKQDFSKHKLECKLLQTFRNHYDEIPYDSNMNPYQIIPTKTTKFECIMDDMIEQNELPKSSKTKSWFRTKRFLLYARVCVVCGKNEYDDRIEKWMNCPTCHFGWCCSQQHFDEYYNIQKQHTKEICQNYIKSVSVHTFLWKHAKEYDDTFLYVPDSVLEIPMVTCPSNWEEYYKIRGGYVYEAAMKGYMSEKENFFPAATHELSQPLTCILAMYKFGIIDSYINEEKNKSLTIHILGPSQSYELFPRQTWEEIMHCFPSIYKLNLIFIGPEACNNITLSAHNKDRLEISTLDCCPTCTSNGRIRSVSFFAKTYHEYYNDPTIDSTTVLPDLIVAMNTGMYEEETESWKATLEVILDMKTVVPAIFTSFTLDEAKEDYNLLKSLNANMLDDGPVLNPFGVDFPNIDAVGPDNFYHANMYYVAFKGRQ